MQVMNGSKNRNCSVSIVFLNKSLVLLHHPGRQNLSALACSWNLLSKVGKVVPHFWDIVPNLDKAGTNLLPGHKLTRVDDEAVYLETKDGNLKVIDVDAVVLSLGVRPVKDLENAAKSIADCVISIGDAQKPGKIVHATRAGLEAAWNL